MESAGPTARRMLLDRAARASSFDGAAPDVTVEQAMRISLCPARESACHCVGKPAVCRRDGPPVVVVCLTAGPDGGPCPGVAPNPETSAPWVSGFPDSDDRSPA